MKNRKIVDKPSMNLAYNKILEILEKAKLTVVRAVNSTMVYAYWEIGRIIVEEEQKGKERAEYGAKIITIFSIKLTNDYGRGFNEQNLWYMKQFYLAFPNLNAVRAELSWTHYRLILKTEKRQAREFYLTESINSNWSTRELERQINSLLYERVALSKDKEKVKEFWEKGSHLLKGKKESQLKETIIT